ncbi:cytochrome b/b6 domain-containing protein [Rhizobium sp. BK602]|uniref:cytochrome b n=1 Tax=Rhizobium sp. BK602 TaxID=2586986 RepID=UPI00161066FD|nr:cytochrome b/b6 domain-containing protein [Rhizobium sp. BK602]MBB3610735.1 cytochrome b561 [Rhizobium sp. BK602]
MLKSSADRYGAVAISVHWLSAIMILALLGSGFRAANAMDAMVKAEILRFHIPIAIAVLLLTLLRIVWWWRFDNKPPAVQGAPLWQERIARGVHVAFYLIIIGMIASGIGTIALSGAGPAIFGAPAATLPNFTDYPPRGAHGLGALLLLALLAFHAGAAFYHQFFRGDGLLRRMWYGD